MAGRQPGTVSNITGLLNEHELDIVNVKVLENLQHRSLGLMASATPDNPAIVAGGGTAVFRVQQYLQSKDYTAANRNDAGDLAKQELAVKIDIEKSKKFHYEIETLDLDGLALENRSAFITYITAGISMSMAALMDAYLIKTAVETAAKDKANREVINAKFLLATEMDAAERETAYLQVADAKIDVARQITRYNIGADEAKFFTFMHKKLTNRLLLAMPKGGDSATRIGENLSGIDGITNVAGLGAVKDHLFFGKNIAAGSAMSLDEAFDFTEIAGVILHGEALFLATQGMKTSGAIDPNSGNQKYISKFNLFRGAVRPELVRVLRTVATTTK